MDKIEILDLYIKKIIENIENNDENEAHVCIRNITSTFSTEIVNISEGLTSYYYDVGSYIEDLKILLSKLVNYKSSLKLEKEVRDYEIKKLELEKNTGICSEGILNTNIDSFTNNFKSTIENIYNLNEKIINRQEKDNLANMLATLQLSIISQDMSKAEENIKNILIYISSNNIVVGLVILPYLGDISKEF